MKRHLLLLPTLLATASLFAGEKANTVLLHPGETIYAHFEQKGTKLKLISTSEKKDDDAQLIFSLSKGTIDMGLKLKIENSFAKDLDYQGEMRSSILRRHVPLSVGPVVGGKVGYVDAPGFVTEIALYDFELEK